MIKRLFSHWAPLGCLLARIRSGRIAMALGGAALVCFSHRALAGLPSPLLEINYHLDYVSHLTCEETNGHHYGQYMAELLISV